jgi:hypothetical protein
LRLEEHVDAPVESSSRPDSKAKHRRQVRVQILAPIIIPAVIGLVLMIVMLVVMKPTQLAVVANCMSVFILLPLVLVCMLPLVLMIALTFGANWSLNKSSSMLDALQMLMLRGRILVLKASAIIARPVMRFNQMFTGAEAAVRRMRGKPVELPAKAESSYEQ